MRKNIDSTVCELSERIQEITKDNSGQELYLLPELVNSLVNLIPYSSLEMD